MKKALITPEKRFSKLIYKADNICIISHHNPDGDAIGSALGLYHILKKKKKNPVVIIPNHLPDFLQWMPSAENILLYQNNPNEVCKKLAECNLIIMVDFNSLSRLGKMENCFENVTAPIVLIDHHPYPDIKAEVMFSDIRVSSTAELVYQVTQASGLIKNIGKEAAACLFTGIMTDTNSFTVNSSRPITYKTTAALLKYGIDKDEIYRNVFNTFSTERMQLLGYLLSEKMVIIPEYKTAFISMSLAEAKKYQFKTGDSEGFVNYPLSIKGIIFSAFLMERKDHIKLSFRSRGNFSVNKLIAQHFSGGGHKNAAGGEVFNMTLEEVSQKLVSVLPIYKELCD